MPTDQEIPVMLSRTTIENMLYGGGSEDDHRA